jgi:hypothetical protein
MLPSTSTIILLLRSTQASAPKSIVVLSLKALLAMAKLVNFCSYLPWAKIKGTYYHWDATTGPNIKGNILGHYFITTLDPSKRA